MRLGAVAVQREVNEKGKREIWPEPHFVNKVHALRSPGESCSDVILRLSGRGGPHSSARRIGFAS